MGVSGDVRIPTMKSVVVLQSDDDWRLAIPALRTLRPKLEAASLIRDKPELVQHGYQLIGIPVAREIVSVAGFAIQPHIEFGRELWIHDLATVPHHQRQGHARTLLKWLAHHARAKGCFRISVHTRLHRETAHRFYEDFGLTRTALVFQGAIGEE